MTNIAEIPATIAFPDLPDSTLVLKIARAANIKPSKLSKPVIKSTGTCDESPNNKAGKVIAKKATDNANTTNATTTNTTLRSRLGVSHKLN